jgi:LCP family protein required for cell wall assembly
MLVSLGLFTLCLLLAAGPTLFPGGLDGRTNILLLGIDRQEGTDWPYRTDTIMVLTMDRDTKAASILSIPRDLQLAIPGYREDRINTAIVLGYEPDDPDAGPALLATTIETDLDIPIDGYLMVDFEVFKELIDALGSIDVYVPLPLYDTRYPDPRPGDPHAFAAIYFDSGWQEMDGERALQYARSRMSTSDFDRAKRQQLILLAVREKALSPGAFIRWPQLARTVLDGIQTDMGLRELYALAIFVAKINPRDFRQVVIEYPLVFDHRRADGADVQLPNWEFLDPLIAELFGPSSR